MPVDARVKSTVNVANVHVQGQNGQNDYQLKGALAQVVCQRTVPSYKENVVLNFCFYWLQTVYHFDIQLEGTLSLGRASD